ERKTLAGDVGLTQCGRHAAQLREQRPPRTLIERTTILAGVLFETGDCTRDERVVISHRTSVYPFCFRNARLIQFSNGLRIRIVPARSGLVDKRATGPPTSSSIRRTYLIAAAGSSTHERARAVAACQPSSRS